jgi:hypothetical protein
MGCSKLSITVKFEGQPPLVAPKATLELPAIANKTHHPQPLQIKHTIRS